jgi:transposase
VSKKTRRSFTADEKAAIVGRHLVDKVPVSKLCDEYGIQPSFFYNWQKVLVGNAARAFEPDGRERARPSREAGPTGADAERVRAADARHLDRQPQLRIRDPIAPQRNNRERVSNLPEWGEPAISALRDGMARQGARFCTSCSGKRSRTLP